MRLFLIKLINLEISYKLNNLHRIKVPIMLIPPPINADIKLLKKCKTMLDTKLPIRLIGIMIKAYLQIRLNRFNLMFGTIFFIILIFNIVIVNIERKKDTIIELMPISGVKAIKLINNITEPRR